MRCRARVKAGKSRQIVANETAHFARARAVLRLAVTGWSSAPVATLMPIECRRPICQTAPLDDDRRRTIAGTLSALISLRTGTKPRPPGHRAVVVIACAGPE